MKITRQLAQVRLAQAEVRDARAGVGVPAAALVERVRTYPLTSVSVAAGAGVAMAQMDFHPLRVPGVSGLLSGGVLQLVGQGVRLLADSGFGPFGGDAAAEPADAA
jgi:hypothetical protein